MNILLTAGTTADEYITQESVKLLSIFSVAGGWIIAALILAPVFWKAGEERWKAYIPVYKWMVIFRLADWPAALGLLGLLPWGIGLIGLLMGAKISAVLLWFQFFVASAGPIPAILTLLGLFIGPSSAGLMVIFPLLAAITGLIFQTFYGLAVYRMGAHLRHTNFGWLVLSFVLPVIALIIFALDRSVWQEEGLNPKGPARIGSEVPRRNY